MQNEPVEVTLKVTGVFEKFGVPYLIGGSSGSRRRRRACCPSWPVPAKK